MPTPMTEVRITDEDGRIFDFTPVALVTGTFDGVGFDLERWRTPALSDRGHDEVVLAALTALAGRAQGRTYRDLAVRWDGAAWSVEAEYRHPPAG